MRRYNGPENSDDYAYDLAVDDSGKVYITGTSNWWFCATIKYDSNGDTAWTRRCGGSGHAIAVDNFGNVLVAGDTSGASTGTDYLTIKYDSNGNRVWVKTYTGSGPGLDFATDIAADRYGKVYVTGTINVTGWPTLDDYCATIKYLSSGSLQWVRTYSGPGKTSHGNAIALDDSSNVYVTGYSIGSGTWYDYITIKYNTLGLQQWVSRYNGSGNDYDEARAIAVDHSGNIYVTGASTGSGTSYDYATIKYNASGTQLWVKRYNGPGNSDDEANAIEVDGFGNIYVTGWSWNGTNSDYATIKYDPDGNEQWVRTYNGLGNGDDNAYDIAIDSSSNVYVTGRSQGAGTSFDYATIKYGPDGNERWVIRYNGPGNGDDKASSIAVNDSGNVYVTGESYGSGTYYDYATIKYVLIPPEIQATLPMQNELNMPVSTNISVTFDLDMDESTINDSTFIVNARSTGLHRGTITYDSVTRTATFNPLQDFDEGEVVTVILTTGLQSYDGVPLDRSYIWSFTVAVHDGTGTFAPHSFYPVGDVPRSIFSADLDGDGDLDLITANRTSDNLSVLFNNGDATFAPHSDYPAGDQPIAVFAADLDGDGDLDLITTNKDSDNISILFNNGHGTFATQTVYAVGDLPQSVFAADLDNDGDLDLITGNYGSNNVSVLLNTRGDCNGDGNINISDVVYLVTYLFKGGPAPVPVPKIGDANCDGKVTVSDVVYLVNYLFKGGPPPC